MFRVKIENNTFVYTCEVLPPRDSDVKGLLNKLTGNVHQFDGINIPSCPLGRLRAHSVALAHILQKEFKIESIPHFTGRHHTVLSFQSELLGAQFLGIKNILCVTGDRPGEGRGFYELNSIRLLKIARNFNQGLTGSREALRTPTNFLLCTDYNPNVVNIDAENRKAVEKFNSGARVFFTQPVFNIERFTAAVKSLKSLIPEAKIIAGISYLHNKKTAIKLQKFLGIPYDYIGQLEKDETALLVNTARMVKDVVDGFYLIPVGIYEKASELLLELRKLSDE